MVERAIAYFRFESELKDHLPPCSQGRVLEKAFDTPGSVKDAIESFGVPHTEVGSIFVNGTSEDFSYGVGHNDEVVVSPSLASGGVPLRPLVNVEPGFILDVHLGRLAAFMRMLGFDTMYRSCASDSELARTSAEQDRILLTRDRGLLMRGIVVHGYWLRNTDSRLQTEEVLKRYHLAFKARPWVRCMACNGKLSAVAKSQLANRVPPCALAIHNAFSECSECGRVYWKGSHFVRMQRWIEELLVGSIPC